jgi:hypothetical protein
LGGSIMGGAAGTLSTATGLGSAITNAINTGTGLTPLTPWGSSPTTGTTSVPTTGSSTPTVIPKTVTDLIKGATGGVATAGTGGGLGGGTNTLGILSSLYDWWAKNQTANQLKGPLDQLSNMYAPGSPEAELMRKQIEARDAAAGRRSQYGPRQVELAGKLAQSRGNILSSPGYLNMQNAYTNNNFGGPGGFLSALGNSGLNNLFGGASNAISNGLGSLSSLFNPQTGSSGDINSQLGGEDPYTTTTNSTTPQVGPPTATSFDFNKMFGDLGQQDPIYD